MTASSHLPSCETEKYKAAKKAKAKLHNGCIVARSVFCGGKPCKSKFTTDKFMMSCTLLVLVLSLWVVQIGFDEASTGIIPCMLFAYAAGWINWSGGIRGWSSAQAQTTSKNI
jgi:hypothetical protein